MKQERPTHSHTHTRVCTHTHTDTQRAHTVPVHLTKPLASWKRLIWAPAAPNHPITDRVISTLLRLSEPSVQVPLFPRRWQDGVVFRSSCRSLWAHPEGLSLARILQLFSEVNRTTVKNAPFSSNHIFCVFHFPLAEAEGHQHLRPVCAVWRHVAILRVRWSLFNRNQNHIKPVLVRTGWDQPASQEMLICVRLQSYTLCVPFRNVMIKKLYVSIQLPLISETSSSMWNTRMQQDIEILECVFIRCFEIRLLSFKSSHCAVYILNHLQN